MNKTMYIAKGQEKCFNSLTCENIIVNGSLRVEGEIRAKHIRGKGFVYANVISAASVTANSIDAGTIIADRLLAERVAAVEIHAVQSMAVSCYLEAELVKAGKIAIADATISELISDEVINLSVKRRGLLGTLAASYVRARWSALRYGGSPEPTVDKGTPKEVDAAPVIPAADVEAAVELLNDPEFLRVKSLYMLSKEIGCVMQLVPKKFAIDKPVFAPGQAQAISPFDDQEEAAAA